MHGLAILSSLYLINVEKYPLKTFLVSLRGAFVDRSFKPS